MIGRLSPGSYNPFIYEFSDEPSKGQIMAYAFRRKLDERNVAHSTILGLCKQREASLNHSVKSGDDSHVLELCDPKGIDIETVYEQIISASVGEEKLGEEKLSAFVESVLNEIKEIEEKFEEEVDAILKGKNHGKNIS